MVYQKSSKNFYFWLDKAQKLEGLESEIEIYGQKRFKNRCVSLEIFLEEMETFF